MVCILLNYFPAGGRTYNPRSLDHNEETLVTVLCGSVEIIESLESHLCQARLLLRVSVNTVGHVA